MTFPPLVRIRQRLPDNKLEDVAATVRRELADSGVRLAPGQRIAIAVGSRGITDLVTLVQEMVAWVRSQGGEPFIIPAMGSHGGATAEGQRQVLAGLGITADRVGADIRSSMEVVELDRGILEVPVYIDRLAYEADGILLVNRIKPHTSFHGPYESGLMKMISVGLGKHAQSLAIHRFGVEGLQDLMPRVARQVLRQARILLGLAVVENARHETLHVRALRPDEIPRAEPALLELAREHMPRLPMDDLDILIIDEIGKDISGLGADPNVIGRLKIRGWPEPDKPRIKVIVARDLTEASHGNAAGVGLLDIITRVLFEKIDLAATYENVLTSTFTERAKIPIVAETDREALTFAIRALGVLGPRGIRVVRIRNTLHINELQVSPPVLEELADRPDIEVLGPVGELFDETGEMTDW